MTPLILTLEDCRRHGFCCRGVKTWLERNGWDWKTFRAEGMPAETVIGTGDAMGRELIRRVEKDIEDGRRV
jgi:hypothetical protein